MTKKSFLFLLTFFCLNAAYAQSLSAFRAKADSLWDKGDNAAAIEYYTKAISLVNVNSKTELSQLYDWRARCYRGLKKYREALNDDSLAIKLDPKNVDPYWNRAIILLKMREYNLSAESYTQTMNFLKKEPKNLAAVHHGRAFDEMHMHKFKEAICDDDTAMMLATPTFGVLDQRGQSYTQSGEFKKGIDDFTQALNYAHDDKNKAYLYENCANNAYFLKDYVKSLEYSKAAIEKDSNLYDVYYIMGRIYLNKIPNKQLAMECFKKVVKLDASGSTPNYAFAIFYLGDLNKAYNKIHELISKESNNFDVAVDYYNAACLFSLMNKSDDAMAYLKKAFNKGYSKDYALQDDDLSNLKDRKDFNELISVSVQK